MSAHAIDLPDDVSAARDGILKFADQEILPRHAEYQAFFEAVSYTHLTLPTT